MRTLPRPSLGAIAAASAVAAALVLAGTIGGATGERSKAEAWRSAFEPRPQVDLGGRMIVVLAAPSLADRMAKAKRPLPPAAQRRVVRRADAFQRRLLAALRVQGVTIHRQRSYTRTFNGFAAVLDARAIAALDRAPGVVGVYPVRAVYAASASAEALTRPEFAVGAGRRLDVSVPGADGSGVTVAVLDTGVDREHPALRGRVLPGVDLVAGDRDASPGASPADPEQVERHGTMMAGIVAGEDGIGGVAPGATILPIRVLGWHRATNGAYRVVGRSDVLLAGLERAVDPNGNGDVRDAADVALAALVEPYAAFADGPEARAVAGATSLGTLVVAAAGNDGPSAGRLGTVGSPGAAPAALTVGAADLRGEVLTAGVRVTVDGSQVYEGTSRVLGAFQPTGATAIAGRELAVLPADGSPIEPRARAALARGATGVVVYGSGLPGGGLDLEEGLAAPVVTLPLEVGRTLDEARSRGVDVSVEIEPPAAVPNPGVDRVAPFSSVGPAFGGNPKPELVAPGIGVVTADAGGEDPRYATVTGSSAAAAVVAGVAALVAEARPSLGAVELAGALVGSARSLAPDGVAEPVTAQGAGAVDPAAAVAADLAVEPVGVVLARSDGKKLRFEQTVRIANLSDRPLRAHVAVEAGDGADVSLAFGVEPRTVRLRRGQSREIAVTATARDGGAGAATASGFLVVTADGAEPARAPWAATLPGRGTGRLVAITGLSERAFRPAKRPASVLSFLAGRVRPGRDGLGVEPVAVLEVELWAGGRRLGVLARYRDLLPGRFQLGLTGRGPAGEPLPPGRYQLRLRAWPADAHEGNRGAASVATASFTIRQ